MTLLALRTFTKLNVHIAYCWSKVVAKMGDVLVNSGLLRF